MPRARPRAVWALKLKGVPWQGEEILNAKENVCACARVGWVSPIMARVSRVFGVVDVCAVHTPQSGGRGRVRWGTSGRWGATRASAEPSQVFTF